MKETFELTKQEEIAVRLYEAKLTGFYANPVSSVPEEPAFEPCLEEAEHIYAFLEAESKRRNRLTLVPTTTQELAQAEAKRAW